MNECVAVVSAKYLEKYEIYLEFNDGKKGVIDLEDIIKSYDIASELEDTIRFSKFFLDSWPTLAWDCGFDIAPESLYQKTVFSK